MVADRSTRCESGEYTIEEIDAITGPALGRPKSATFRTLDIAGIDVLGHVVANLRERLPATTTRDAFALPPLVEQMLERGLARREGGPGLLQARKSADGESEILTLDPATLEYRPKQRRRLPSLDAARSRSTTSASAIKTLFLGQDKVGEFLRATLGPTLVYTARVAPDIAHSIDDVDRAMRWGFGWELGPFEILDAIGVREVLEAVGAPATAAAAASPSVLAAGRNRFRDGGAAAGRAGPADPASRQGSRARRQAERRAPAWSISATACWRVEFHSKMNAIGGDTIQMLQAGVQGSRRELRGARRRQRRAELLGRRQPDAACCSKRRKATGTRST